MMGPRGIWRHMERCEGFEGFWRRFRPDGLQGLRSIRCDSLVPGANPTTRLQGVFSGLRRKQD
jgi:hypothetical protein